MIALALAAAAANAEPIAESIAVPSAVNASPGAVSAHASVSRMETTNVPESAPLNLVSRTFVRILPYLDATLELQRLTYKARESDVHEDIDESALKQLLLDISGDGPSTGADAGDTVVKSLQPAVGELQQRAALEAVTPGASAAKDESENLASAVKAALSRDDVKVYSAVIENSTESSNAFFLVDEETNDILVIIVTSAKSKHGEAPSPALPTRS